MSGISSPTDLTTVAQSTQVDDLEPRITAARATLLDNLANLDALISSRAAGANALSTVQWTNARAALLDSLDAAISSRAPSATALSTAQWSNTRAGYLDNLSGGAVALAATALSTAQWSNTRAGYLDNLSGGAVALAATALSNVQWTNARAGYLDNLASFSSNFKAPLKSEAAKAALTSNATQNVLGAYTQIVASSAHTVCGLLVTGYSGSADTDLYRLAIATGGAGSEVPKFDLYLDRDIINSRLCFYIPVDTSLIGKGVRVAMAIANFSSAQAEGLTVSVTLLELND